MERKQRKIEIRPANPIKREEIETIGQRLDQQLVRYIGNIVLPTGFRHEEMDYLPVKASQILHENNEIAANLQTQEMINLLGKERSLKGDAKVGYVICVDGRLQSIHFGRVVNIWEEPASFFKVEQGLVTDKNNQENLGWQIASSDLIEALRTEAEAGRELFEIVFAHAALTTGHDCGYANALSNKGEDGGENRLIGLKGKELIEKNLEILEEEQSQAITNTYNTLRHNADKSRNALSRVAVTALFDTDSYGIVLNYGQSNELSTTKIIEEEGFKEIIESQTGIQFASLKGSYLEPKTFMKYYGSVIDLTERLMDDDAIGINQKLYQYIESNYGDLTEDQKQAFLFTLTRRIASQYVTGMSHVDGHPDHRFSEHAEEFAAVGDMGGALPDRFNLSRQSFGITSSDPDSALHQVRDVAIPLLNKNAPVQRGKNIVFLAKGVERGRPSSSDRAKHAEMFKKIIKDHDIKQQLNNGSLLLIPVLVDEETGLAIDIPDYSNYF